MKKWAEQAADHSRIAELERKLAKHDGDVERCCEEFKALQAADIVRLERELAEAREKRDETQAMYRSLYESREHFFTEAKRLRSALEKYGRHPDTCNVVVLKHRESDACTCGLDAALEATDNA